MSKSLQLGSDYSKQSVPNLSLPIITEEGSNFDQYSKNLVPLKLAKDGSLEKQDDLKSARSVSMLSMLPEKEADGVLINTKMSKKLENGWSLLGQLRYAQWIQFSKAPTLVMEFSADYRYLATGGQDGVLRIWEILHPNDNDNHLIFLSSEPFKEFQKHTKSIVDISWHTTNTKFVLTASYDKKVILWNIENDMPSQIYTHSDIVTSVWFKPGEDIFATGSFDKNLRLWSIKHKRVVNWLDQKNVVTAVQFSTDGERLISGNMKGLWFIFDTKKNNLVHLSTINCKNRKGFFSKGRTVIDIKFTCNREAIVSTADSRIRYIDLNNSKQKFKYKGHTNKTMNIRTSISEDLDLIMTASEDGKVYVWQNMEEENSEIEYHSKQKDRSDQFETFIPGANHIEMSKTPVKNHSKGKGHKSSWAIFTPMELVSNANFKLRKCGVTNRTIKQIILVGTLDGKIKVFHSEIPL